MELTGGFPYLVQLALYNTVYTETSLESLLQDIRNDAGVFSDHVHEQLWRLQQNTDLADAFQQVIMAIAPIPLEEEIAFELKSLGLVKLLGKEATVSCGLYREFFSNYFKRSSKKSNPQKKRNRSGGVKRYQPLA
jgi:hypothetical protein